LVEADSTFTNLGLDSLTAVELRNRLQQVLGRGIPATAAFEWPTISLLAGGLGSLYAQADPEPAMDDEDSEREEMVL
jgi:acyl carrier protein